MGISLHGEDLWKFAVFPSFCFRRCFSSHAVFPSPCSRSCFSRHAVFPSFYFKSCFSGHVLWSWAGAFVRELEEGLNANAMFFIIGLRFNAYGSLHHCELVFMDKTCGRSPSFLLSASKATSRTTCSFLDGRFYLRAGGRDQRQSDVFRCRLGAQSVC